MISYYNEIDPYCVQWLRNLIAEDLIPFGVVDDRDIRDVRPHELAGYTQCHFFAGLGGWPLALRMAGWDDDREVWTGSCPCQPFSAAGRRLGFADERDLWPAWHHIIEERHPSVIFGEQVASKDGALWLSRSRDDMEGTDYAFGCADLPACGVEAPQKRSRSFFVACANVVGAREEREQRSGQLCGACRDQGGGVVVGASREDVNRTGECPTRNRSSNASRSVGGADDARSQGCGLCGNGAGEWVARSPGVGFWRDCEWLFDTSKGVHRRVKPGVRLLAHGVPARVAKLRALGNAIVPQIAAEFIISSGLA